MWQFALAHMICRATSHVRSNILFQRKHQIVRERVDIDGGMTSIHQSIGVQAIDPAGTRGQWFSFADESLDLLLALLLFRYGEVLMEHQTRLWV